MTNQVMPAVNNTQAQAFMQSLSPDQLRILMGAVAPQASQTDALSTVVEALADRLAGNGLTADMASYWADQLDALVTDNTEQSAKDAVSPAINMLRRAGHINASTALDIESGLRQFVNDNKSKPQATVEDVNTIDVQATPVRDNERVGFQSNPQGTSGQVPVLNSGQPVQQGAVNEPSE